jgi:hypothetical protein
MKWKSKIKVGAGLVMTCTLLSVPRGLQAQRLPSQVMTILQSEASFERFYETRTEFQKAKQRELVSVPFYNQELAKEVHDFHLHISDRHFRHVQCKSWDQDGLSNPAAEYLGKMSWSPVAVAGSQNSSKFMSDIGQQHDRDL